MPLSWDIFLRWLQKILFFKRFFIFFRLRYCPILNFCCPMICCCRYGCFYCSSCCFGLSSVLMIGDFCFQILTEHLCFVRLSAEQVPIFLHFRCCGLVFHFSELWLLVSIPVWVFRYIFPDFRGFLHFFPHWYCGCRSDKSCYRGFLHRIDCCFHLNVRGSDSPLCYCWSDGCFPSDELLRYSCYFRLTDVRRCSDLSGCSRVCCWSLLCCVHRCFVCWNYDLGNELRNRFVQLKNAFLSCNRYGDDHCICNCDERWYDGVHCSCKCWFRAGCDSDSIVDNIPSSKVIPNGDISESRTSEPKPVYDNKQVR